MTPNPFHRLAALDRLLHEPARLALSTALLAGGETAFPALQRLTGLTKGNLSSHLGKLEGAGLVRVTKETAGGRPTTRIALTAEGRARIGGYWVEILELAESVLDWPPEPGRGR